MIQIKPLTIQCLLTFLYLEISPLESRWCNHKTHQNIILEKNILEKKWFDRTPPDECLCKEIFYKKLMHKTCVLDELV